MIASALKDADADGQRNIDVRYKPVFTIDHYIPFDDDASKQYVADSYAIAREIFHKLNLTEYICQIIYNDLAFLRFWTLPTRLIYLDSAHHYGHTKEAIYMLMDKLMLDGWLVLHDYVETRGVLPALNEFLDEQTQYDIDIYAAAGSDRLVCIHLKDWS